MRLLIGLLWFLFAIIILAVMLMNTTETVTIRLWVDPDNEYRDVSLAWVLFVASFSGIVFMGLVAVLEGMKTRLDNARLSRQVRRLQRELDGLRAPALPSETDLTGPPGTSGPSGADRDLRPHEPAGAGRSGATDSDPFGV